MSNGARRWGASIAVLGAAPPGELGRIHDRRAHRRHVAATMLDLAERGHLRLLDAGNDPNGGYSLDWYLLLPGGQAPLDLDATDPAAVATAHVVTGEASSPADSGAGRGPGPDAGGLRPHEQAFLDVVRGAESRLLSRVRAAPAMKGVVAALIGDLCERGWLQDRFGAARRTRPGRAVAADLRAARAHLAASPAEAQVTASLLPVAVTLGLEAVWMARLGQQRPAVPEWFTGGSSGPARGWLGVCAAASAMAAAPPPGGGAGSAYINYGSSSGPLG